MAQLTEADRKLLLGARYKEAERLAEIADHKSVWQRLTDSLRRNCEQIRNYALMIAGIAAVIVVTNYLQVSGPYERYLGMGMATAVVVGVICAALAHMAMHRKS
jgi:hypothetical protein